MRTVEIPGGSATIREAHEIRVRDEQLMQGAAVAAAPAIKKIQATGKDPSEDADWATEAGLSLDEWLHLNDLNNAAIVAMLAGWTLERPVPQSVDDVKELPAELGKALGTATIKDALQVLNGVDFDPSDPSKPGFEQTPTEPSAGSAPRSGVTEGQASTATPSPTGVSIATDGSST